MSKIQNRLLTIAAITAAAALAASSANAQALQSITTGANIVRDTVAGISLALGTIAVLIAGYKIMFAGATFRDCSNLFVGAAVCGGAAAIAGVFITG